MAEGAALEVPYTGNCIVGSNPTLSASEYDKGPGPVQKEPLNPARSGRKQR